MVVLILALGGILYVFKQKAQAWYGGTELLVGVAQNFALISKLKLEQFPHVTLASQEVVGLFVFTYIISRGVNNVVEGVNKLREKPDWFTLRIIGIKNRTMTFVNRFNY